MSYEPCSNIMEEGGPLGLAEYIQRKSDNLWDVFKHLSDNIARDLSTSITSVYNEMFQESILETFPNHDLTAAYVNDGSFAIIFDTSKINIVEKIDLNLKVDLNNEIDKPKKRSRNSNRLKM